MLVDPARLAAPDLYKLMISVVVPRPIAWVSTLSPEGVANAAPFSYFQALSSHPPMVMVSVGPRRGGAPKDTRRNIEATREFVVNIVSESSASPMVRTSVDHPPETSEFDIVGLERARSEKVRPPRIAESAVAMECRLDRVLEIGSSAICIGEVLLFHIREDVLGADGTVDPWKLRPLGRLGGADYAPLREVTAIGRDGAATTLESDLLDLWRDLRRRSVAMARALTTEHLQHAIGDGGDTVGRVLRHMAGATTYMRLKLEGREQEDEFRAWNPTWTPERLALDLEEEGRAFEAAVRVVRPGARDTLQRAIRHEAWHQGQIAAALRKTFRHDELWHL
jgi:flavin reductase (DIM6/NTAB) family NADH-FMN oxidoreductase RutF/uncharacterized damage-inducible protein DinB